MARAHFERLSVLDSTFLGLETQDAAMHIALMGLFEAGPLRSSDGGVDLEAVRRAVSGALPRIPRYRQKLRLTPVERRPVWIDDDRFDVGDHILCVAVPHPGTDRELKQIAARIVERPLDRSRPLWEIWAVDGLCDDRIALVFKVHHCMTDGVSGVELMGHLLSPDPEAGATAAGPVPARRAPAAGTLAFDDYLRRWGMYWRGWRDVTHRVFGARSEAAPSKALQKTRATPAPHLAGPLAAMLRPASLAPFNQPIGPRRRLAWIAADMADVERIRFAFGCSLNDVVLGMVTGAVRGYLDSHGEDLQRVDFRVMAPVSLRSKGEHGSLGNKLSAWIVRLPVAEGDPAKQIEHVAAQTRELKASDPAASMKLLTQIGDWLPPRMIGAAARNVTRLRPFNMVVTNIPGPPFPLYMRGARLLEAFPVVPLADRLGLGIALLSYDGKLYFGFNADYDLVPDLELFVELMSHAFDSLIHSATSRTKQIEALGTG